MSTEIEQRSPEEIELLRQAGLQPDGVTPIEDDPDATPLEPSVETPTAIEPPPAPEVLEYRYQPKDEAGRPMGGEQVIKYTTQNELADKLRDNSILILRKLRLETRNNRLGITQDEEISDTAPRYTPAVEFKPVALTQVQRAKLSRDLLDPDTFDAAADELLEARIGAKPSVLADTVNQLQQESYSNRAITESSAFMEANPGFYKCEENGKAITSWLVRFKLAPVRENFQKAYETLKAAGVLVDAAAPPPPPFVEAPFVAPTVVETPALPIVAPPPPVVVPRAGIGSGLTRDNSSPGELPARPSGDDIVFEEALPGGQVRRWSGLQAVDRMSSEVYKHRLKTERGFAAKVDKLEASRGKRK
jgi:hypothetical protein